MSKDKIKFSNGVEISLDSKYNCKGMSVERKRNFESSIHKDYGTFYLEILGIAIGGEIEIEKDNAFIVNVRVNGIPTTSYLNPRLFAYIKDRLEI